MRIAVIGGGSIATSFLVQLARCASEVAGRLEVDVYEPAAHLGPGEPYAVDEPDCALLNAPSFVMSAVYEDKEHFLRWLKEHDPTSYALGPTAFLPRAVYGRYLRAMAAEAESLLNANGCRMRHWRRRIDDIEPIPEGGYHILCEGAKAGSADHVLLCIGNLPADSFASLKGHSAYIGSPYPASSLRHRIAPHDHVVVLGTSLSAIDAIVALRQQGHKGPIRATSRQGRLPAVRLARVQAPLALVSLSEDGLRGAARANGGYLNWPLVQRLFLEDYLRIGGTWDEIADATRRTADPARFLEEELDAALARPRLWMRMGLQVTHVIELLWSLLDEEGKRAFRSSYLAQWATRRTTFPVVNARILLDMLRRGQLTIGKGLREVRPAKDGNVLEVLERDAEPLRADVVVNATGFSMDAEGTDDSLVQRLLARGLATRDAFGGFALDLTNGCLRGASAEGARNAGRIAAIGALASGAYFWTYSMDVNVRIAARQVGRLLSEAARPNVRAAAHH